MRNLTISKPVGGGGQIMVAAPGLRIERAVVTGSGATVSVAYSGDVDPGEVGTDGETHPTLESETATVWVMEVPCEWPEEDWELLDVLQILKGIPIGFPDPVLSPKRWVAVFVNRD